MGGYRSLSLSPDKPSRALLGLDNIVAYDTFNRADSTGLGTSDSGHAWSGLINNFNVVSGAAVANGTSQCTVAMDAGAANGAVSVLVKNLGSLIGITFRAVDGNNYLWLELTGTDFRLRKRASAVNSTLLGTTVAPYTGDTYVMSVKFVGDRLAADLRDLSGRSLGSVAHTLSAGDMTAFGTATRVGLLTFASATALFDNFVVRSAL